MWDGMDGFGYPDGVGVEHQYNVNLIGIGSGKNNWSVLVEVMVEERITIPMGGQRAAEKIQ